MTQSKFGFSSLNQNLGNTTNTLGINQTLAQINSTLIPVRVYDIILDDTHPKWITYGGWNGLGTIEFKEIYTPDSSPDNITIAKPLYPQLKNYPLINEIVLIFRLPNQNIGNIDGEITYYYLNSISIWNHPHHNAYPNPITENILNPSQQKDYQDIEGGSIRRVTDGSTEINLNSPVIGGTFIEKTNIHPLLSFAGDNIIEGRFGNSIRLGNTSKTKSSIKNNWSGAGENGDPITILRNGQDPNSGDEGWIPIVENINKDLSSIYLTSTQKIPLISSSNLYGGLSSTPKSISTFNESQILLNSNRIILNSKTDSILLSSAKNINLSSEDDIGIATQKKLTLYSPQVKLGDKTANERIILGDRFITQFNNLLTSLNFLCEALEKEPQLVITPTIASTTKESIRGIQNLLQNMLSNTVRTI